MSKLNIIQKRELDPLMLKADRIAKHYEKAADCFALALKPETNDFDRTHSSCINCDLKCAQLHMEAVEKAKILGGSYVYLCSKGLVFWTSPFYSGERYAGAFISGGLEESEKNSAKVKSLAQMTLTCANQISRISFIKKNVYIIKTETKPKQSAKPENEKHEKEKVYPLDMERMLLASLRRGDNIEGQKILVNLLKIIYLDIKGNFQDVQMMSAFRIKALELAVLLSRAVADPKDIKENFDLETVNRCFKKIEESSTFEEISDVLCAITEKMSEKIFSFHGVRHFSALRKAERYIWTHYTKKLSLKEIAEASGLSAPYFSTVFKEEMGENLSNYLNRLRVDKAAAMLITTDLSISQIASACGFEDQSWFSKIFKNNTGFTPGKYREIGIHTSAPAPVTSMPSAYVLDGNN